MNNKFVTQLEDHIAEVRNQIIAHPLYDSIQTIEQLQHFTQWHVVAVWDFMSLLKSLQHKLTCVTLPWMPVGNANTRFLINEIVTGEESDVDENGNRCSHYELYRAAMAQMGAHTTGIDQLLLELKKGQSVSNAVDALKFPEQLGEFIKYTFRVVEEMPVYVQAAVFTYGREDLIPDMFHQMVSRLQSDNPGKIEKFQYYLERHIEVDGDHHSHLAREMVIELCGDDAHKWKAATTAVVTALEKRKGLWDGVLQSLPTYAPVV